MHSDPHAFEQLAQVLLASLGGSAPQPVVIAVLIALSMAIVLAALAPVLSAGAKLVDSIGGLILVLRNHPANPKAKPARKGSQRSRPKR